MTCNCECALNETKQTLNHSNVMFLTTCHDSHTNCYVIFSFHDFTKIQFPHKYVVPKQTHPFGSNEQLQTKYENM